MEFFETNLTLAKLQYVNGENKNLKTEYFDMYKIFQANGIKNKISMASTVIDEWTPQPCPKESKDKGPNKYCSKRCLTIPL